MRRAQTLRDLFCCIGALALSLSGLSGCANSKKLDSDTSSTLRAKLRRERDSVTWRELRTPNIVLVTDYSLTQARVAIEVLERAQQFLAQAFAQENPRFARKSAQVHVLLFRDLDELQSISNVPIAVSTFFDNAPRDFEGRATIVAGGPSDQNMHAHWLHEMTHYELRRRFGTMPAWLDEGLAMYYANVVDRGDTILLGSQERLRQFVDDDRGFRTQELGTHSKTLIPRQHLVDASDLLQFSFEQFHVSANSDAQNKDAVRQEVTHYAESWLLIHMLQHGPSRYQKLWLKAKAAVDDYDTFGEAVQTHLESVPRDQLDRDLATYAQFASTAMRPVLVPEVSGPNIRIRELSSGDALAYRVRVVRSLDVASKMMEEARQSDADSLLVLNASAQLAISKGYWLQAEAFVCNALFAEQATDTWSTATRVETMHLALWTSYMLEQRGIMMHCGGREMPWEQWVDGLEARASTPAQWHSIARFAAARGELERADCAIARAIEGDPGCWSCFETRARIAWKSGDARGATRWQSSAIARTPTLLDSNYRDEQASQYELYRTREPDAALQVAAWPASPSCGDATLHPSAKNLRVP